jgi:hypothetical protein
MAVRATYEFSGMGDYWSGNGRRWDKDAGCLFAFYGPRTTLREIVDSLVEDYWGGGDCDEFPEDVTSEMIREAIMTDMLNDLGRADVASGALAECAEDFAGANDLHGDEDEDDCMESPIFVALIEIDVCPDCGAYVEDADEYDDGLCADCALAVVLHDEPEDEDFTVTPCGPLGGKSALGRVGGWFVGEFDSDDDAIRAARTIMADERFFPNIWLVSDHGNWTLYEGK